MTDIITPGHDGHEEEKPSVPACPFRHAILPGTVVGQLTFRDLPCLREHCALWNTGTSQCSFLMLGQDLCGINHNLETTFDTYLSALRPK